MDNPEQLYHIIRTTTDFQRDKSGSLRTIDVVGTYTDLTAAKAAARRAITKEGFPKDWFEEYVEKDSEGKWPYDEAALIHARAPGGEEFDIILETRPNALGLKASASGQVQEDLYHVLQTKIDYNAARARAIQSTEIEGTYTDPNVAIEAARTALLGDDVPKDSFLQWEEYDNHGDDWVFGDDVVVHAVSSLGENFRVAVKKELKSLAQAEEAAKAEDFAKAEEFANVANAEDAVRAKEA